MSRVLNLLWMIVLIISSLFIGSIYYYYSPFYHTVTEAIAFVRPLQENNVSGVVRFVQEKEGVHITALMYGLPPGEHGFHIHEFGDCSGADAAGDHFNPTGSPHGAPKEIERHVGDLGNITADADGKAEYNRIDQHITLNGPQAIIGHSVIVHAKKDDFVSQPSGDAGARIACGVIGIRWRK